MTTTERFQEWFASVCDGDWEHSYRIQIGTLDNPGWSVSIPIVETSLENRTFSSIEVELTEQDWYHCRVEDGMFHGRGGPRNLLNILTCFLEWAEPQSTA
jgi:hypothetical protein